jgi:hypothetical protein
VNENRRRISTIRRVVSLLEQNPPKVAEAIEELKNADPSVDGKRIAFELARGQIRVLIERRDLSQDERRSVAEAMDALTDLTDRTRPNKR